MTETMKTMKQFLVFLAVVGMTVTLTFAAEDTKKAKPCCEPTMEAQAKCSHKCCIKAAEGKTICKKCHPEQGGDKKK
jgi:hypothetical protein